jgi:predicted RNase H-like HicB family nuclease
MNAGTIHQIKFDREEDGRWIAEIPSLPGMLAYGDTQEAAMRNVCALVATPIASEHPSPSEPDALPNGWRDVIDAAYRGNDETQYSGCGMNEPFREAVRIAIDSISDDLAALAASQTGVPREPTEATWANVEIPRVTVPEMATALAAPSQPEARQEGLREALAGLMHVIDAAGLHNLSRGVQLGPISWFVKASDACDTARAALARHPKGEDHA